MCRGEAPQRRTLIVDPPRPPDGTAVAGSSSPDRNALLIGTGDAAVGTNLRNLDSLGGKVRRVDRDTGAPMPDNPYAGATMAGAPSSPTAIGTCRVSRSAVTVCSGRSSTGATGTTRSTGRSRAATTPGTLCPATTSRSRWTDQSLPGVQQEAVWSSGMPPSPPGGGVGARCGVGALDGDARRRRPQGLRTSSSSTSTPPAASNRFADRARCRGSVGCVRS